MVSVLTTDFGPHPAEKWAQVTAERILPDNSPAAQRALTTLMRLRADVIDILTGHHAAAQAHERDCLGADAASHFTAPLHGPVDPDGVLGEIQAAAAGTPWEAHLAQPDVAAVVQQVIADHTAGLRQVERLWHADNHPTLGAGQAYRAAMGQPPSVTK